MPIQTPCPSCKTTLALPENAQGKSIRCPKCNHVFAVPAEPAKLAAPVPAPPAPPVAEKKELQTSVQAGTQISVPPPSAEDDPKKSAKAEPKPPPVSKAAGDLNKKEASPRQRQRSRSTSESSVMGIVMLLVGGLGLLTLCVACTGVGWFLWPASDKPKEVPIARNDQQFPEKNQNRPEEKQPDPPVEKIDRPVEKEDPIDKKDFAPEERGEKLTRRASLAKIMAEIKPPQLEADRVERELPEVAKDVVVGRAGRYLLVQLANQVAVFDVSGAKLTKFIPLAGPNAKIAAGRDHMLVVYPDDRKIERWSLLDFKKEATAESPATGKISGVAMGAGSLGPLYIASESSTLLIDIDKMKPMEVTPKNRNFPRGANFLRASLDGTVFGMRPDGAGEPHTMGVVTLNGSNVAKKEAWGVPSSLLVPGSNGKFLYSGGAVYSPDVQAIFPIPAPASFPKAFVPAVHGPYFMKFDFKQWQQIGGSIEFFIEGKYVSFARVENLDGVTSEGADNVLTHDKRVTFIPKANLLVCIPKTNDKLMLARFDPVAALKNSGKDFLVVLTEPDTEAKKGAAYRYQVDTLARNGKVSYELQVAPAGMTVSPDGLVSWNVPADFTEQETRVIIIVSNGAQQVFHSFPIEVSD